MCYDTNMKTSGKKASKKTKTQWEIFWEPLTNLDKKIRTSRPKAITTVLIFLVALLLPLIGWSIGAQQNPQGWMSDSPGIAYSYIFALAVYYWFISIPIILIPILAIGRAYDTKLAMRVIAIFVFVLSLIASLTIKSMVERANESEFTG